MLVHKKDPIHNHPKDSKHFEDLDETDTNSGLHFIGCIILYIVPLSQILTLFTLINHNSSIAKNKTTKQIQKLKEERIIKIKEPKGKDSEQTMRESIAFDIQIKHDKINNSDSLTPTMQIQDKVTTIVDEIQKIIKGGEVFAARNFKALNRNLDKLKAFSKKYDALCKIYGQIQLGSKISEDEQTVAPCFASLIKFYKKSQNVVNHFFQKYNGVGLHQREPEYFNKVLFVLERLVNKVNEFIISSGSQESKDSFLADFTILADFLKQGKIEKYREKINEEKFRIPKIFFSHVSEDFIRFNLIAKDMMKFLNPNELQTLKANSKVSDQLRYIADVVLHKIQKLNEKMDEECKDLDEREREGKRSLDQTINLISKWKSSIEMDLKRKVAWQEMQLFEQCKKSAFRKEIIQLKEELVKIDPLKFCIKWNCPQDDLEDESCLSSVVKEVLRKIRARYKIPNSKGIFTFFNEQLEKLSIWEAEKQELEEKIKKVVEEKLIESSKRFNIQRLNTEMKAEIERLSQEITKVKGNIMEERTKHDQLLEQLKHQFEEKIQRECHQQSQIVMVEEEQVMKTFQEQNQLFKKQEKMEQTFLETQQKKREEGKGKMMGQMDSWSLDHLQKDSSLDRSLANIEEEVERKKNILNEMHLQEMELREKVSEYEKRLNRIQHSLFDWMGEWEKVSEEKLQSLKEKNNDYHNAIEGKQKELASVSMKIQELTNEYIQKQRQIEAQRTIESKISEKKQELDLISEKVQQCQLKLTQIEEVISGKERELEEVQRLKRERKILGCEVRQKMEEKEQILRDIDDNTKENDRIYDQAELQQQRLKRLQQEIKRYEERLSTVKNQ